MENYGIHILNPKRAVPRLTRLLTWIRDEVPTLLDGAKFNLDTFGRINNINIFSNLVGKWPKNVKQASKCGFEGCVAGWATLCPELRKEGLTELGYYEIYRHLAEFFGISYEASEVIFGASDIEWDGSEHRLDPHDPREAAQRLERFLKDQNVPIPEQQKEEP